MSFMAGHQAEKRHSERRRYFQALPQGSLMGRGHLWFVTSPGPSTICGGCRRCSKPEAWKEKGEEKREEGSQPGAYSQDPEFWSFLELSASAASQTIPLCWHGNGSDKTLANSLLLRALCPSLASSQRSCFGDQDTDSR